MKALVCLLLVVTIAPAGCADKKQSKVAVVTGLLDGVEHGTWPSTQALRNENARLRGELSAARIRPSRELAQENVRLRIELTKARQSKSMELMLDKLYTRGADVLDKIAEVRYEVSYQPKAVKSAERAIEAQRVTIEVLEKMCRLYEDVLGKQRSTIELLKKICRIYENEVNLEG